jgi:hypothetical protein
LTEKGLFSRKAGRDEEFDLMVGLFITLQSFQRSAAVQP